jgi:hypothetical protein
VPPSLDFLFHRALAQKVYGVAIVVRGSVPVHVVRETQMIFKIIEMRQIAIPHEHQPMPAEL